MLHDVTRHLNFDVLSLSVALILYSSQSNMCMLDYIFPCGNLDCDLTIFRLLIELFIDNVLTMLASFLETPSAPSAVNIESMFITSLFQNEV